jgi:hypothetical protein
MVVMVIDAVVNVVVLDDYPHLFDPVDHHHNAVVLYIQHYFHSHGVIYYLMVAFDYDHRRYHQIYQLPLSHHNDMSLPHAYVYHVNDHHLPRKEIQIKSYDLNISENILLKKKRSSSLSIRPINSFQRFGEQSLFVFETFLLID